MRLIDADALEQKFSEIKHYLTKDLVMDAVYEINKAPTIDPVKHGHWKYPLGMAWNYVCSECGANGGVEGTPFCPSCGARMDGEVEADLLIANAKIKQLEQQLADYHHTSELVNGKMEENQRLRRISENLQEQLAAERAKYAELQRYNVDCTKQCGMLQMDKVNLQTLLTESQRRERAAVEDMTQMAQQHLLGDCTFCKHRSTPDMRHKPCKGCIQKNSSHKHFEWRGPQDVKGDSNER